MIKKSLLSIAAVAAILTIAPAVNTFATTPEVSDGNWVLTNGKYWYEREDKSCLSSGVYKIKGVNYGFDGNGYLAGQGWLYDSNYGKYYFINEKGTPITGWLEYKGSWYYLNPDNDGAMVGSGWNTIGGCEYYFNYDGSLATNRIVTKYEYNSSKKTNGYVPYLLDGDGRVVKTKGWNTVGGYKVYVSGDKGELATDCWKDDYYLKSNGCMATNGDRVYQATANNKTVYLTESGVSSYYVDGDYYSVKYTGAVYQFGHDGKLIKGLTKISDDTEKVPVYTYSNEKGEMPSEGWLQLGKDYYYVLDDGTLANDELYLYTLEGHNAIYVNYENDYIGRYCNDHHEYEYYYLNGKYMFTTESKLITGWYQYPDTTTDTEWNAGSWVYSGKDGKAYSGWISSGNDYYYAIDGYIQSDRYLDHYVSKDGKYQSYEQSYAYDENGNYVKLYEDATYYLDLDGKMVTGWYDVSDDKSGSWIYANASGTVVNEGWVFDGGKYYAICDGHLYTDGSINIYRSDDGKIEQFNNSYYYDPENGYSYLEFYGTYYIDKNGAMITGWYDTSEDKSGSWIYLDKTGKKVNEGWVTDNGKSYYISYGSLARNQFVNLYSNADGSVTKYNQSYYYDDDGNYRELSLSAKYYVDDEGVMVTGWYDTSSDKSGSWIYAGGDGKVTINAWIEKNGKYYAFNNYGYMISDGFVYIYSSKDGKVTKFNTDYYYDDNGHYNSLKLKDKYYVDKNGQMITGWYDVSSDKSGSWIYAKASGILVRNDWLNLGGKYYFFNDNGYMLKSSYISKYVSEDGKVTKYNQSYYYDEDNNYVSLKLKNKYYVDQNGAMITGWYKCEDKDYETYGYYGQMLYANSSGILANGWTKINGAWYCFNYGSKCTGVTCLADIDTSIGEKFLKDNPEPVYRSSDEFNNDTEYYRAYREYRSAHSEWNAKWSKVKSDNTYVFDENGKLVTGWYKYKYSTNYTEWLYADKDGKAYTGWVKSGGKDYYIDRGIMLTNTQIGEYYLGVDGACL